MRMLPVEDRLALTRKRLDKARALALGAISVCDREGIDENDRDNTVRMLLAMIAEQTDADDLPSREPGVELETGEEFRRSRTGERMRLVDRSLDDDVQYKLLPVVGREF